MFYSEMKNNGLILIWQFFSTCQIRQLKAIPNICQSIVFCKWVPFRSLVPIVFSLWEYPFLIADKQTTL
jgi:hypothetical protein